MDTHTKYVVTPWRDSKELLQLRHDLYGSDIIKREKATNKVFAWRLRRPTGLPLLLDSTADIVDVIIQEGQNELKHNALRLLYATALSRFITGLADTQIDLIRDKPSWFPPGKSLQLPLPLLEIRHRIVHRHLPSLAELKRAAQESLDWLWEWYWSQLDYAFGNVNIEKQDMEAESVTAVRERLQSILKTYVKERKHELKTRKKDSRATETAISTYGLRYASNSTSTPSSRIQTQLIQLLVDEKMILPTDKKLGSNMLGAFLIWTPLLLAFTTFSPPIIPITTILEHITMIMNAPSSSQTMINPSMDPVREGMCEWLLYILFADEWRPARAHCETKLIEDTLVKCFTEPTFWNLKVAEHIVQDESITNREQWLAILKAAQREDSEDVELGDRSNDEKMDVDVEKARPVSVGQVEEPIVKEKIRGPQKVLGMWKPRPIGWISEGWEDDE